MRTIARCRKKYGGKLEDIEIDVDKIPSDKRQPWMFVSEFKEYLPELMNRYSMIRVP